MNILNQWKYFQRTDLDFLHLAYKKRSLVSEITVLDERRRIVQKEILSLSSISDACKNCPMSCCRGNYNHFTAVDYMIRMFSEKPIREFALDQQKPPSLWRLINEKIGKLKSAPITSRLIARSDPAQPIAFSAAKCPNLNRTGCAFLPEDRPIRCVLYTCNAFRHSLPEKDLERMGLLTAELSSISQRVFRLFQK